MREMCLTDLYFLLTKVCARKDLQRDWLFERCREVQKSPDGHLDLWFREAGKSSIITFGLTVQNILQDPNVTVGIFSYNRPTSKFFLWQIKREFETNETLKSLFPDILWANPNSESPRWSMDEGIIVKRSSNLREATVEAWGLVDGQPTGRHFRLMIYDDVVTLDSVTTPEMCQKTTRAWEMSRNLMTEGGRTRYIGTRYCLVADTLILMADWSHKEIKDVCVGDVVVGWKLENGKRYLRKSRVLGCGVHQRQKVLKYNMECGRSVICTPDHKWWRGPHGGGEEYREIGLHYHKGSNLRRLLDPYTKIESRDAGWLAGFFDGEGTVKKNKHHASGSISISQSMHNPDLIIKTRQILNKFGFKFSEQWIDSFGNNQARCNFSINGGWRERYRFLTQIAPHRFDKIENTLFAQLCTDAVKIKSIDIQEDQDVFWIETETGNYVANGFCSKNSYNDSYGEMMRRDVVKPRIYPVLDENKQPVLLSPERVEEKRKEFGPYVFSSQMLLDPVADEAQNFRIEWIKTWDAQNTNNLRIYILVDPASKKKKHSDYTAMFVIGLGLDRNYYIIDMIRDRLNLTERMQVLFGLHEMYRPVAVGYEEYGMQSDIEHLQYVMEQRNYRFPIFPLGGNVGKEDRIRSLVPVFEQGRIYLPQMCIRTTHDKKTLDLTKVFIEEEYKTFPVGAHDDMLDALARILDHGKKGLFATFPTEPIKFEKRVMPSINKIADMEREKIFEDVIKAEEWEKELYDY